MIIYVEPQDVILLVPPKSGLPLAVIERQVGDLLHGAGARVAVLDSSIDVIVVRRESVRPIDAAVSP